MRIATFPDEFLGVEGRVGLQADVLPPLRRRCARSALASSSKESSRPLRSLTSHGRTDGFWSLPPALRSPCTRLALTPSIHSLECPCGNTACNAHAIPHASLGQDSSGCSE